MWKGTTRLKGFFILFLFMVALFAPFCSVVSATATINGISPSDGSFHVDITNNPPDPGGYITLSWTITDNTGGGDLEFYMDIWNGDAWVNRQHLINQNSGSWHQDETSFNTVNTTYQWRVNAKDGTDGVWTNETYSFTTDRKPAKPVNPSPANNSYLEKGDVVLSVEVNHPDNAYGAKIYNVTFYEYPSNHIVGYNKTVSGWDDGTTVVCNSTYRAEYNGTTYYWYAKAKDDEYWGEGSDIFRFTTYYNDTEPDAVYHSMGAVIYAEGIYSDGEPATLYYSMGARIASVQPCEMKYPQPPDGSVNQPGHGYLKIYAYKEGEHVNYQMRFYANDTLNESWHQQGSSHAIELGTYVNNLTMYDAPFSSGTLDEVELEGTYLRLKKYNEVAYGEDFEDGLAQDWTIVNASCPTASGVRTSDGVVAPVGSYYLVATGDDVQTSNASVIDLSGYVQATISYYLGSRGLEAGEYTKVEVYDGAWHEIKSIQNVNPMQQYTNDVTSYISADFRIRIFNSGTNDCTDYSYIDSIVITGYYYSLSGSRTSPIYALSGIARRAGAINWTETKSENTNIVVFYDFSSDNGTSWTGWAEVSNHGTVDEISDGTRLDWCRIKFRQNLSTDLCNETPLLKNFTFNVDRYTEVHEWYETMNLSETYYWYVTIYNELMDVTFTSDLYHFTTKGYDDLEPDVLQYSFGAMIYAEEIYSDLEPNTVYYSLGGVIAARTVVSFSNPIPENEETDVRANCPLLSIDITSTVPKDVQMTFQQNDSGTWEDIPAMQEITTDDTVTNFHYQLQYDATYYWRVKAYNVSTALTQYSSVYKFTTKTYDDIEPSDIQYSVGAVIYVEGIYSDAEIDEVWYSFGGMMPVGRTLPPTDPYPVDGSTFGRQALANFSCYVEDFDGDDMTVTFYNAATHVAWDSVTSVLSGERAETHVLPSMTNGSVFNWYVTVDDGNWNVMGPTWSYIPLNRVPTAWINPDEGAIHVPVRRKSASGVWQMYVNLLANVSDYEHDDVTVQIYIDNPSLPNWNDWVMRFSHIHDPYSVYNEKPYEQDEVDFDEIVHEYHWRVYLEDEYGASVNYYMNFTTEFYFWADFNWTLYRSTNDDMVLFIDESQNATSYWWYINSMLVANASGLNASDKFNMTYQFNISNVYNITQTVYNESSSAYDSMTRYIYIDRNVSLDRSLLSAVVFYGQSPKGDMKASELCTLLGISSNAWVHKYNTMTRRWISYWVDYPGITTDFDISLWDALAFTISEDVQKRINITDNPDQREAYFSEAAALENTSDATQTLFIPAGLCYVCWSNISSTTSPEMMMVGLSANDEVYLYNTSTDIWKGYKITVGGTIFDIRAYDIVLFNLAEARVLTIEDGFPDI